MVTMHPATLFVVLLLAGVAGALIAVLPMWRSLGAGRLPVRTFIARRGVEVQGDAMLQAEIRCSLCSSQPHCRHLLEACAGKPPADCPNSKLFG